jgi:DNA-binding transcriptional regulator YhcF (GntR family)
MYIFVHENAGVTKYRQIINSVENAIAEGKAKKGDMLPSVNKVRLAYSLSRDTVLLAYDELKKRGIVSAIPGKGYYIRSLDIGTKQKIFLLFDELNIFKEDIYNAFLAHIGEGAQVDIFFHHFNPLVFRKLIKDSLGNYTKYIIMPTNMPDAAAEIKTLPVKDVYVLDQTNPDLKCYPAVYQNFVKDIYDALQQGKLLLDKYQKLIMIFPGFREPLGMKEGFLAFCNNFGFANDVIPQFNDRKIEKGEAYIIPNDRDLVRVIEAGKVQGLRLGDDYGIVSYNDTPLKKVAENGITTISTDFEGMGKLLADMVRKGPKEQIENKCSLIVRKSL